MQEQNVIKLLKSDLKFSDHPLVNLEYLLKA